MIRKPAFTIRMNRMAKRDHGYKLRTAQIDQKELEKNKINKL